MTIKPTTSQPKQTLKFDENAYQISIIGKNDGKLNPNQSINEALGYKTAEGLLNKIETLETKINQNFGNTYTDRDDKAGTVSRLAMLDFLKEAGSAYGIDPSLISYSNTIWEGDVVNGNNDGQIDVAEFKKVALSLETEIRNKTGKKIDLFNFKAPTPPPPPPAPFALGKNVFEMTIMDKNVDDNIIYGQLDEEMSFNNALGFNTAAKLFSSLEKIENDLKKTNPKGTSYKDADKTTGTVSAYAVQDFFTRAGSAYGIKPEAIAYNNIVYEAAKSDGNAKQLTLKEFKVAAKVLESEIKNITGRDIDIFNFLDSKSKN